MSFAQEANGNNSPQNAIRCFSGAIAPFLLDKPDLFQDGLPTFFKLTTIMNQALGLTGYIVLAMPKQLLDGSLPGEFAIVAYESQEVYNNNKGLAVRETYSQAHWLLFDKAKSFSNFPTLFDGKIEINKPVCLATNEIDWQNGTVHVIVGLRDKEQSVEQFLQNIGTALRLTHEDENPYRKALIAWTNGHYLVCFVVADCDLPGEPNIASGGCSPAISWFGYLKQVCSQIVVEMKAKHFKMPTNTGDKNPERLIVDSEGSCYQFVFDRR